MLKVAIGVFPLKAGLLNGELIKPEVISSDLKEEGCTSENLTLMAGWNDCIKNPVPEGYICSGNIVTSVS